MPSRYAAGSPTSTAQQRFTADQARKPRSNCRFPGEGQPAAERHPSPRRDWTYDKVGNRLTETSHTTTGNTTRSYTVPTGGKNVVRPHAVTAVTTQTTGQPPVVTNYGYDQTGNTTCRPAGTAANTCPPGTNSQHLAWDAENRLTTISGDAPTAGSNIYDADGNRLLRRDATGTTLYLPGQEVRREGTTTTTATRYYTFAGKLIASRTPTALNWTYTDHHGTQHTTINAATEAVTTRRQTPYGNPRDGIPIWPNQKGFVGGDIDPTGLTHLGAREYDPALGRFISVDPLLVANDPRQYNGYQYGGNSPIANSDPSGLGLVCGAGVGCAVGNGSSDSDGGSEPSQPTGTGGPTVEELLDTPVKVDRDLLTGMAIRGYDGSEKFTSREILKFAAESTDNWVYVCTNLTGVDSQTCEFNNPVLPEYGFWEEVALMALIVGAFGCAYAGPVCLEAALVGAGEFAATGSLVGGAGIGAMTGLSGLGGRAAGAGAGCLRSFDAETQVLMADGTTKPVKEIKVGDLVLAIDPQTSEQGPRKVTHLWIHEDQLVNLKLADGTEITTTEDHPFWNHTDQQWQDAQQLDPGDLLLTPTGIGVPVQGLVRGVTARGTAYNLTVVDVHTYYVMAGNTPVLVHNDGGDDYNQAMNKALKWLDERGFVAERTTIGKFGTIVGQPIGMQTADGKTGFRIEFDERNGAHINVWSGKEKGPHFKFDASERTVTKIQGQFGCK